MSGGAFDYEDQKLEYLAETLQEFLNNDEEDNLLDNTGKVILQDCITQLKEMSRRLHHLDWALSGDTDMETSIKRIIKGTNRWHTP